MIQPFKHFVPRKHKKNYTYQSKNQPEHKNLKRSKVIEYVKFLHKYSNSHNKNSKEFKDERKNLQVKHASICYSLYNELTTNSTHCSLRRDGELPVNIGQMTQQQEPEECYSLSISFAFQIRVHVRSPAFGTERMSRRPAIADTAVCAPCTPVHPRGICIL